MAKVNHKSWFRWLKSRQVEKTRRQSIAILSRDHSEYAGLINTKENQSKPEDAILEEVIEDAILVESNRSKAEHIVEKVIESLQASSDLITKSNKTIMRLTKYARILSALVVVSAAVMLYLWSTGHGTKTCEDTLLSRSTTWLAALGCIIVLAGYLVIGKVSGGVENKALLKVLDDARTVLKLLQLEEDPSSAADDTIDGDDAEDFSLGPGEWSEPSAKEFPVRGSTYLRDNKKVECPTAQFKLLAAELVESPENIKHIAMHPKNRVARALARGDQTFWFVFNFMIPGPPNLSFVAYWELDKDKVNADTPFGRIAKPFFFGDDDKFRDARLKVFPRVTDGNFAVKMAIKNTPAIMGQRLDHSYYRGDNYFELDVDISGRPVARNLTGICIGYAKTMALQMALILQGEDEAELPEAVMAVVSASYVDILNAKEML